MLGSFYRFSSPFDSPRAAPTKVEAASFAAKRLVATSAAERARLHAAFEGNYAAILRFLRRAGVDSAEAEDLAQDVFLVAFGAMWRISRGGERAFLQAAAARLVRDHRRREKARPCPADVDDLRSSPLDSPEQLADQKLTREALDGLVARLDPDQGRVFVLVEFEGFTVAETSRILRIPLGTASSRLRAARRDFALMTNALAGGDQQLLGVVRRA
jgi:RNA polymerase sigma-70 factor (ECF subfamily)